MKQLHVTRSLAALAAAIYCAIALSVPARAATPAEVDNAVIKGQKFLLSLQKAAGHWETGEKRVGTAHDWEKMQGDSYGGFTSVATYALLASGMNSQDPHIIKAVEFLKTADVIGIYSLGLRCQVWLLLPEGAKVKKYAADDLAAILGHINPGEPNRAMWDYGNGIGKRIDHSVSQYGILGVWACERMGIEVPLKYWQLFDQEWRAAQYNDGGWSYDGTPAHPDKRGVTPSMTAAGVATLFITQDYARASEGIGCRGNISNSNIDQGLIWMGKHIQEVYDNYTWYGVERIGVASGYKYFGATDWYATGAERLVRSQKPDGSWDGGFAGATPIPATSFALLFLSRGRAPVMMNKLQYHDEKAKGSAKEGNWNQRPRDVANLARWTGERIEADLNWQIVNLKVSPDALHDAPILYLSGNEELNLGDDEEAKLKEFVHDGGMILANADCNNGPFAKSFATLGSKLFGYEFRELPQSHPIYTAEVFHANKWRVKPKVMGLSNGVRELMLLVPEGDPGKSWQARADQTHAEAYQLGADIFLYAIDKKNLSEKGISYLVREDPKIAANRSVKVARLEVGANWDPEPGAWPRLAAVLHNQDRVAVQIQTVKPQDLNPAPPPAVAGSRPSAAEIRKMAFKRVPPDQLEATGGDPEKMAALIAAKTREVQAELDAKEAQRLGSLASFKVASLTGTTAFELTDAQRQQLLEFIKRGGTLIVDAAGGSSDFASSAEAELKKLFGDAAAKGLAEALPPSSPIYNLPGAKIESTQLRTYAKITIAGETRAARVRGIEQGGRMVAFYSREDLTGGLVGEPVDGVLGYTPESATDIMRNLVLYAAFGTTPPPAPPTVPAVRAPAAKAK